MSHDHVTHLLARYCHGQLRPAQHARVTNHIRVCPECRAALAREERFAADLRREMPAIGQPRPAQLAQVWAGVLGELSADTGSADTRREPAPRAGRSWPWLPAVSMALAVMVMLVVALPLLSAGGLHAEAAPQQPRPISTSSPTPGAADTLTAVHGALVGPQATVALARADRGVRRAGATPAPVPGVTASPGMSASPVAVVGMGR